MKYSAALKFSFCVSQGTMKYSAKYYSRHVHAYRISLLSTWQESLVGGYFVFVCNSRPGFW